MNSRISSACIKALGYSAVFSFPLTFEEIFRFSQTEKPFSRAELSRSLVMLERAKKITKVREYYFFPGTSAWAEKRIRDREKFQEKLEYARSVGLCIARVWGVRGVLLSGSLGAGAVQSYDDLDFVVITRKGLMWTTRFLVVLFLKFVGLYRGKNDLANKELEKKACTNLWMDESTLELPLEKQTLYSARELIQAQPIACPLELSERLLQKNTWMHSIFANAIPDQSNTARIVEQTNIFPRGIEWFFRSMQKIIMSSSISNELIFQHQAFFHPTKRDVGVMKAFQDIMKRV
ncbi:MAG: hypothetical protein UX04_C0002G0005 [Microgenomates group bacterium GW2011_GWF2_45_18]|nr:MAG: hypothetical protein UW18_C0001G0092 [Microgenomates group bacterium GW2011_GWF1_44_10]KKU01862.1 MAG: hypothetical protein UX04_C0002G0005 [Microgenomates group bacterium GW2011_GWF2_45_18]OGJ41108.1 MAG: hypothetical protein A2378_04470 [Candidatus Pacebacteria bacterium RIFOXYB1_FULL_44_10]HAU98821.1 hypothetical protein [Candidatus Paceibacterota bacterium]HAX01359.1 hypothetical protein [Candidatus Paceibacterota bacterium]